MVQSIVLQTFRMSTRQYEHPDRLVQSITDWWENHLSRDGFTIAFRHFAHALWEFARESTLQQKRKRYGDVDFDWDHRVDTTSATVGWHDRLLGALNSPYQPTEEPLFHEMIVSLNVNFREFTFIDIGSGKGRTLLMASNYPFRRILGVELLPGLHYVAEQNIAKYKSDSQLCHALESICIDARKFVFPMEPMVLYLFNPLPAQGLDDVLTNLEQSLQTNPRPVFALYHNPEHEHLFTQRRFLQKIRGTHQYSLFSNNLAESSFSSLQPSLE